MATHSSVLAWRIPGTGEPGGLPSMGSHRVGPDWSDLAAAAALCIISYWSLNWFNKHWYNEHINIFDWKTLAAYFAGVSVIKTVYQVTRPLPSIKYVLK